MVVPISITLSALIFLSVVYIVNIGTGFPGYTLQVQIKTTPG